MRGNVVIFLVGDVFVRDVGISVFARVTCFFCCEAFALLGFLKR